MKRRLPPLKAIRCFESAAEHENFALAADELGVTKGAVSQQIKALETFLGQALFDRTGRGVRLSDAGRRYHSAVRNSLTIIERATDRVLGPANRQVLRLTALPAFASMWLVPRLSRFQDRHTGVDIQVSAEAEIVDFDRSDAHLGIRYAAGDVGMLDARPLGRDRLLPVCTPAYARRHELTETAHLGRCRLLHDTFWQDDWKRWCRATGTDIANLDAGQYFTLYSMAVDAARAGAGIAIGHALLVADDLSAERLVAPFPQSVAATEEYFLVIPERARNLAPVRSFADWLLTETGGWRADRREPA